MAKKPYSCYRTRMNQADFEWDSNKNLINQQKHGVSFHEAQYAFLDENKIIADDISHSQVERRYYCFGMDRTRKGVLTIRFAYINGRFRIIGAGYWRKGRKTYERANSI